MAVAAADADVNQVSRGRGDMSRTLTTSVSAVLSQRRIQPTYLVDMAFDSETLYLWTGFGPITWNGNVYTGAGNILDIKLPDETTDIRAEGAKISLSGIPSSYISLALQEPYQGRVARVWLAFLRVDYDTDPTVLTATDSTSNNNDGTLVGGPAWVSDGPTDRIRGALSFDGVDDYVSVPVSAGELEPTRITMEIWVNTPLSIADSGIDEHLIERREGAGAGRWFLIINTSRQAWARFVVGGTTVNLIAGTIVPNEWTHIAGVFDGSECRLLIDGTVVASQLISGNLDAAKATLTFGSFGAANQLKGYLADARVWSAGRTQSQIQANMNTPLTGTESGLVGYWPLDDGVLAPNELIADPVSLFAGRMDQMVIDEQGDTSTIGLAVESNLIDLNKNRERRYTDQDQKSDYPSDLFFEYVAGLQHKRLTWGPDNRAPNQRVQDIANRRADVHLETRRIGRRFVRTSAVDASGNVLVNGLGTSAPYEPPPSNGSENRGGGR